MNKQQSSLLVKYILIFKSLSRNGGSDYRNKVIKKNPEYI